MKIKITPMNAYTVEIDGQSIPGTYVRDGDPWHGMTCLKGAEGSIIFMPDQESVFKAIIDNDSPKMGNVISASPFICARVGSNHE